MPDDFSKLRDLLVAATREHFERFVTLHPGEAYYGYSLYTDDGVASIGPVATTGRLLGVNSDLAPDPYFRYGPHEWAHFDDFGLFGAVNEHLRSLYVSHDFESYRRRSLDVAFRALESLEALGVFGARDDSRFIVLWVVDSDDPIVDMSARKLNSQAVYAAYASEYGAGSNPS